MTSIPSILIDSDGSLHTLYTEELDLFELGEIANVHRASRIEFDQAAQVWRVIDASTDEEVYRDRSRLAAIEWEIAHFSPGGIHYHGS